MEYKNNIVFSDFVRECTCAFTTVETCAKRLQAEGFEQLSLEEDWKLAPGGKYYLDVYKSTLLAFCIGEKFDEMGRLLVAAAHTDAPGFVVKPHPVMKSGKYCKINVESYGGAILNTWLDRPLGVAGLVVLKGKDAYHPETILWDSKRPLMVIPNVAIHFNRDVNKGVELNKQTDMLPLAGILEEQVAEQLERKDYLLKYVAEDLGRKVEDILDFQLYVYNTQTAESIGFKEEILLAPRIDNIASVFACVEGIVEAENPNQLSVIALFDNEEVGSRTKQGAASDILSMVLERIYDSLNISRTGYLRSVSEGFFLSLDGAHAVHPNHAEKSDPVNAIYLNDGIVIKKSANQSYSTDAVSAAVVKEMCHTKEIPYKEFVNRSDIPGGSTLGAIASTKLPMRMVDVGVPMLAMHSAMELTGQKDIGALLQLVKAFLT